MDPKGPREKVKGKNVEILLKDVPDYLYDQIKNASEQMGQTIREWIIGACHMRYANQFRDNLLRASKARSGDKGNGSPVI
jgi:hypothetical protein